MADALVLIVVVALTLAASVGAGIALVKFLAVAFNRDGGWRR